MTTPSHAHPHSPLRSRARALATPLITLALILTTPAARADFSLSNGFDSSSGWFSQQNEISSFPSIVPSGGNPGGYADFRLNLTTTTPNPTASFGTYSRNLDFFMLTPSITQITIAADSKFFSGSTAIDLLPMIVQQNLLYFPQTAAPIPLSSSTSWTSISSTSFPLSDFANSTHVPLNPAIPSSLGFRVTLRGQASSTILSTHVGVDNINLSAIPAPAAATGLLFGPIACVTRRTRRR